MVISKAQVDGDHYYGHSQIGLDWIQIFYFERKRMEISFRRSICSLYSF